MNYIIKTGDSLSKIALKELGDMSLWQEIARINGIVNPNLIFPGQVISLDIPKKTTTVIALDPASGKPVAIAKQDRAGEWIAGIAAMVIGGVIVNRIVDQSKKKKAA